MKSRRKKRNAFFYYDYTILLGLPRFNATNFFVEVTTNNNNFSGGFILCIQWEKGNIFFLKPIFVYLFWCKMSTYEI